MKSLLKPKKHFAVDGGTTTSTEHVYFAFLLYPESCRFESFRFSSFVQAFPSPLFNLYSFFPICLWRLCKYRFSFLTVQEHFKIVYLNFMALANASRFVLTLTYFHLTFQSEWERVRETKGKFIGKMNKFSVLGWRRKGKAPEQTSKLCNISEARMLGFIHHYLYNLPWTHNELFDVYYYAQINIILAQHAADTHFLLIWMQKNDV